MPLGLTYNPPRLTTKQRDALRKAADLIRPIAFELGANREASIAIMSTTMTLDWMVKYGRPTKRRPY